MGAVIGADLAFRYSYAKQIKHSKALEDYYIESRIVDLSLESMTFKKADEVHANKIIGDQATLIRGGFLALVDLQKTGHYKLQEGEISKALQKAKKLIDAYPSIFIGQSFIVSDSKGSFLLKQSDDSANQKGNALVRKQLQDALDYVATLPTK